MLQFLIYAPSFALGFPLLLILAVFCLLRPRVTGWEKTFASAALAITMNPLGQYVATQLSRVRPMKLDLYAYRVDALLGNPSFLLGQLVWPHSWAKVVLQISYGLMPLAIVWVVGMTAFRDESRFPFVFKVMVLNWVLAPLFYLIIPICGPLYAFSDFPAWPAPFAAHPILLMAAPNGMPSIHTSTAILVFWLGRRWRVGSVVGGVYLVLIVLATLSSGQHYAIDLLAAIPYAALMLRLARGMSSKAKTLVSPEEALA